MQQEQTKWERYAGEKIPSMHRRCNEHDYTSRRIYMVTINTEGRRPLLGRLVGEPQAQPSSPNAPRIELSPLGRAIEQEWLHIPDYYLQVKMIAHQVMPDHFHGILFITAKTDVHLGQIVKGFKTGCNRLYRQLAQGEGAVEYTATQSQFTQPFAAQAQFTQPFKTQSQFTQPFAVQSQFTQLLKAQGPTQRAYDDRKHGMLWERGYHDRILLHEGQLQRLISYVTDNPRRLAMKRPHPDLFRVHCELPVGRWTCSALGNLFLKDSPSLLQVQCSRRLSAQEITERTAYFLGEARRGAVLVSPSISPGEKTVMRAAFNERLPLILLCENGLTAFIKPSGEFFEACADGRLLMLSPWTHHNERQAIRRYQCMELNELAAFLCK